jgi:Galactose oxidase, central domain/Kelch motif
MNRSDWLTDELIQAAFERRAGRAAPGDLRETILTLSAALSQRSPWRLLFRSTMSTPVHRPALLKGVAAATVFGVIAVGAALFVTRPDQPAVGGPSPTPNATVGPSAPAGPSAGPSAAVVAPRAATWTATGKMITPRLGHKAILLLDGRVLVVGGGAAVAGANDLTSAELYDPATGTWASTGSTLGPRADFSATLLADGKVLVAGGAGSIGAPASAEVYDPDSGTWSATGNMVHPLNGFPATLLRDGRVLVGDVDDPTADNSITGAEVYEPESGTWSATGKMIGRGAGGTATLLRDGRVLVGGPEGAQLYDPDSGTWSAAGNMITPTAQEATQTATLLSDGKVLFMGITDTSTPGPCCKLSGSPPVTWAELYDPQSGAWSATQGMVAARVGYAAVLLADGKVLVTGRDAVETPGVGGGPPLPKAELYDPASGTWSATASMVAVRDYGFSATLLADGKVLVAGGMAEVPMMGGTGSAMVASAELYDPGSGN